MRINREMIVKAASAIVDESGLNNTTLKEVAKSLNIQTPSLYNHIKNLDDLLREVAHNGMKKMNEKMIKASIGNYGEEAIKLVATEYLEYMIQHPGVYETIQWSTWHGTKETERFFNEYLSFLTILIDSCKIEEVDIKEILNLLTGFIHGYTTLQLHNAFVNQDEIKNELRAGIGTLLLGARQKASNGKLV